MLSNILNSISQWFDHFSIPFQIDLVFDYMVNIWDAFPTSIRFSIIGVFSLACFIAILKMLF